MVIHAVCVKEAGPGRISSRFGGQPTEREVEKRAREWSWLLLVKERQREDGLIQVIHNDYSSCSQHNNLSNLSGSCALRALEVPCSPLRQQ